MMWTLIKAFEEGTSLTDRIVWKVDEEPEEIVKGLMPVVKKFLIEGYLINRVKWYQQKLPNR